MDERTHLRMPADLAQALDELIAYAKQKRYLKRSATRNDLIRHLLQGGVDRLRAEMIVDSKGRK